MSGVSGTKLIHFRCFDSPNTVASCSLIKLRVNSLNARATHQRNLLNKVAPREMLQLGWKLLELSFKLESSSQVCSLMSFGAAGSPSFPGLPVCSALSWANRVAESCDNLLGKKRVLKRSFIVIRTSEEEEERVGVVAVFYITDYCTFISVFITGDYHRNLFSLRSYQYLKKSALGHQTNFQIGASPAFKYFPQMLEL